VIDSDTADLKTKYEKMLVLNDQLILHCHRLER